MSPVGYDRTAENYLNGDRFSNCSINAITKLLMTAEGLSILLYYDKIKK
jgi:hypothetical protein